MLRFSRSFFRLAAIPALSLAAVLALSLPTGAWAAQRPALSPEEYAPLHVGPADIYLQEIAPRIQPRYEGLASQSAMVSFHIGPNGAISQARVMGGSGSPEYDQAVLQALREASPLPPPPTLNGMWANMVFSHKSLMDR